MGDTASELFLTSVLQLVRRLAVAAFSAAAQHKPYLLQDHLPSLLPLLLKETEVRPELIRKIPMGPFTSKCSSLR